MSLSLSLSLGFLEFMILTTTWLEMARNLACWPHGRHCSYSWPTLCPPAGLHCWCLATNSMFFFVALWMATIYVHCCGDIYKLCLYSLIEGQSVGLWPKQLRAKKNRLGPDTACAPQWPCLCNVSISEWARSSDRRMRLEDSINLWKQLCTKTKVYQSCMYAKSRSMSTLHWIFFFARGMCVCVCQSTTQLECSKISLAIECKTWNWIWISTFMRREERSASRNNTCKVPRVFFFDPIFLQKWHLFRVSVRPWQFGFIIRFHPCQW